MGEDLLDMSVVNNCDPVRDIHDFIQFEGNQKDSNALIPLPDQHFVYIFDSADIQAPGRRDSDQELWLLRNLTSDNNLLLITAGKTAREFGTAVLGTHIVSLNQFLGKAAHLFAVDAASG